MFNNKNVALYVTGSIAVYKSLSLVRLLVKSGANVRVIMTKEAQKFVTPLAFQTLTKNEVFTDTFNEKNVKEITHINIAMWADFSIVAPATANIIAKMANGIADDAVSTTLLATASRKIVVPAMNNNMWDNPATQRNIAQIKHDNVIVLNPDEGFLAEGYTAKGRMIEPEDIVKKISEKFNSNNELLGKKVLVTAGGTQEAIDPVRYISNFSSGKMGYAIANAAVTAGADVTLITTKDNLPLDSRINRVMVKTSSEMQNSLEKYFDNIDILVMAAAVSDYRPEKIAEQKIKKTVSYLNLHLVKTNDILLELSKQKKNQFMVGFAAETQNLLDNAQSKLNKKKLDMLCANDVSNKSIGFNSNNNQISLIDKSGVFKKTSVESKTEVAKEIIKAISERI